MRPQVVQLVTDTKADNYVNPTNGLAYKYTQLQEHPVKIGRESKMKRNQVQSKINKQVINALAQRKGD